MQLKVNCKNKLPSNCWLSQPKNPTVYVQSTVDKFLDYVQVSKNLSTGAIWSQNVDKCELYKVKWSKKV